MTLGDRRDGIPAGHVLDLLDVLARRRIPPAALATGLDLDLDLDLDLARLEEPGARVSLAALKAIAARARALTNDPLLGVELGLRMRASTHGYLGFAAMTSATIREALELATRFAPTRTSLVALRVRVDGEACSILVDEREPLGPARELVVLALLVGIAGVGSALTGRRLEGAIEVTFSAPSPPPPPPRDVGVDLPIVFGCPCNRLCFPAKVLDLPIVHSDRVARRLAEQQCERELAAVGGGVDVPGRVRDLLARAEDAPAPTVADVAARLGTSTRTLKRRLAERGTDFSTLVEEAQCLRALALLGDPNLSLDEVAARVGYANAANFTRAFRRWTGSTPGSYRRSRRR